MPTSLKSLISKISKSPAPLAAAAALAASLLVAAPGTAQDLFAAPVHDEPKWHIVTALPNAPGAPVAVRSLATNQLIGALAPDTRFLKFGGNGQVITFALNGTIGYIPAAAAVVSNPVPPENQDFTTWGKSLEQLAQEAEDRSTGQIAVSLEPQRTPAPAPSAQSAGVMPGGIGTNLPYGQGANPQPGAALATGGLPALGNMAGAPMGGK